MNELTYTAKARYNGDHIFFVRKGIPAVALTAGKMPGLRKTITHTKKDLPELLDYSKPVDVAVMLQDLVIAAEKVAPWINLVKKPLGR